VTSVAKLKETFTAMPDLLLALFAGVLTIAAPCTLPVLPVLLGASVGRRSGARPALIAAGFIASFAFVALALNAVATALHFDPDALRTAGLVLLVIFGVLMIWPAAFERLTARLAGSGIALRPITAAQTNLGGFVLGTTLGLIWTPCAGPVLGAILTAIATSPDRAHGALLLLTYTVGAALPMLGIAYGGQAISTRLRSVAPYTARLQQAFGVIVIAFALSAFLQYDAIALAWLGQFVPEGRLGL
jgi:cytochrome c biogenesis protein CcdA